MSDEKRSYDYGGSLIKIKLFDNISNKYFSDEDNSARVVVCYRPKHVRSLRKQYFVSCCETPTCPGYIPSISGENMRVVFSLDLYHYSDGSSDLQRH